jgi:hypothetical protein
MYWCAISVLGCMNEKMFTTHLLKHIVSEMPIHKSHGPTIIIIL